jgi:hypothetical protein
MSILNELEKYENGISFDELFHQIETSSFIPITNRIKNILDDEGIFDEFDDFDINNYQYMNLKISDDDKIGLMELNPDHLDKFNEFDIQLKDKYKMKYIDFIDYDNGNIIIVRKV